MEDLDAKSNKFLYHAITWLRECGVVNPQGKSEVNHRLVLILDMQQLFSKAKTALQNATSAMKDRGVNWDYAPAEQGLENYLIACILFALIGGLPEKSKSQKDGSVIEYQGRVLTGKDLVEATGTCLIFLQPTDVGPRIIREYHYRETPVTSSSKSLQDDGNKHSRDGVNIIV